MTEGIPESKAPSLDLEKAEVTAQSISILASTPSPQEFLVEWDGPDDPSNPKNWSSKQRWTATFLISFFASIYPIGSTIISPCIETISQELHITNSFIQQLCLSIFILGIGVGPLILSPLSEVYGRVPILYGGTLFFLVWNTVCGFATNQHQLIAFRFFSGFGASAALSVGSGVIGDLWKAEERGRAIAFYTLGPLLAPAFGPIAGAYITQGASWRWVFWGMSIATVTCQAMAAVFLRETYAPRILRLKVAEKRERTGEKQWHSEYDEPAGTIGQLIARSLTRPFRLLGAHPIIQLLAVYVSFCYGLLYIIIFTFPLVWTEKYHQSTGKSSLNFISTGIGYVAGSQFVGLVNDRFYRYMKAREKNVGRAEFRVPIMMLGAVVTATGLFIYGWASQEVVHWVVPNIGAALVTAGLMVCFQSASTFAIDTYTLHAASASATIAFTRSLAGFGFPLFARALYHGWGYGWGNSLLAFVTLGVGLGIPMVLWVFGSRLAKALT